jgi:Uma2 family endonuclease
MRKGKATYDDLLALPDNVVGEIVDGELYVSPRPALPHAAAASALGVGLGPLHGPPGGGNFGGPGGWWILVEPELHFGEDIVIPDLAGWRRERMPTLPNLPALELPPDWVCEVASPSTERLDRAKKMAVYARVGVPHLWIVSPLARLLEVYRLQAPDWVRVAAHAEDERARIAPFDAIELELARWWEGVET